VELLHTDPDLMFLLRVSYIRRTRSFFVLLDDFAFSALLYSYYNALSNAGEFPPAFWPYSSHFPSSAWVRPQLTLTSPPLLLFLLNLLIEQTRDSRKQGGNSQSPVDPFFSFCWWKLVSLRTLGADLTAWQGSPSLFQPPPHFHSLEEIHHATLQGPLLREYPYNRQGRKILLWCGLLVQHALS